MTTIGRLTLAFAVIGGIAAPLGAQISSPNQGYAYPTPPPTYTGPGPAYTQNQNVLGAIIDQLIGNRYRVSDRQAIRQCTLAAVNKAEAQYRPYYRPNFRRPYSGYTGDIRVTAITDVQRRSAGRTRVRGLLDTGLYRVQTWNPAYAGQSDLNFRCDVDSRGRVYNVNINQTPYWGRRN